MDQLIFLQDLTIVMVVGALITILFQRLRIPVVIGYLCAGLFVGPHTFTYPLVTNLHDIHILSELGIIFLLFTIGLEFSITKLLRIGPAAVIAAAIEIPVMMLIGYTLAKLLGWKPLDCLFLGAIICISSTTIIAKVLVDLKMLHEKFAQMILGILIVEDLVAIVIIALLPGIALSGGMSWHEAGISMMRVISFMVAAVIITAVLVPRILNYVAGLKSHETMTVTVLGLVLGGSMLAVRTGFSAALGAFIMGAVIAETRHAHEVIRKMHPLRDMFTAVFFVSVGMQIEPSLVAANWKVILLVAAAAGGGKFIFCTLGAFLTGHGGQSSFRTGLGLAQIGEFSFIIAKLGQTLGVTSGFLYPVAVSVSAITAFTTPMLMRGTPAAMSALERVIPKSVSNFAHYYTSWLSHIGGVRFEGGHQPEIWKGLRRYFPRLAAYMGLGAVLYFMALQIRQFMGLEANAWFWTAVGVVMFPVLLGVAHTADRIFWNVILLNLWRADGKLDPAGEAGRGVHNVFRFLMMVFAGLNLIAIGSFFDPVPPVAVGVTGLMVISGVLLWGSVREAHEKIEGVFLGVFDRESGSRSLAADSAQDELAKYIRDQYPWEVETLDFVVPYRESALHQSLHGLGLRSATGTSIVAIYRGDLSIPNPGSEEVIQAGDVLLLMGDKEQIRKASNFLREKAVEDPPSSALGPTVTQKTVIRSGAACIGRSIRQIGLRSVARVTILGLERAGVARHNPDSDLVIESGDILILFGHASEVRQAAELLSRMA
jgi:CPA2 family monovalent cation:H+ antiporter-2